MIKITAGKIKNRKDIENTGDTRNTKKYLITSALPYVNNVPHIGNIAGSHLPADVYARYCRLKGRETIFVGGTDEHGTPSEVAAQKLGVKPRELCDKLFDIHKKIYNWLEISYDNFSRTSKEIHHKTTQEFFLKLYEKDYISEDTIDMLYCEKCERFLPDRYVKGTCPRCGYESARGDQCESCTVMLDPTELINPRCVICGNKPIVKSTKHLFLELGKLSDKLEEWINGNKHWRDYTRKLALGIIKDGLRKRCITRDLKWGVKVPIEGYKNKTFYVWFDAPIGYISSTKELAERVNKDYGSWWKKGSDAKIVHFIGKDNIPFHTVFFPAMLIGNEEYTLPYQVVGYHYLNYEGEKISKSKNLGVFCEKLLDSGTDSDIWRFYLILKLPEKKDTEFGWNDFKSRVNTELIDNLSNFVNRTLSFVKTKYNWIVPDIGELSDEDKTFIERIKRSGEEIEKFMEDFDFSSALWSVLELSKSGNIYFQSKKPWEDPQSNSSKAAINLCTNLCQTIAILLLPFLPNTSERIRKMLNINEMKWDNANKLTIAGDHKISEIEILFKKLDDKIINELKNKTTNPMNLEELFK